MALDPQLIYYAGRNVASWESTESAMALIEKNGARGGLVIDIGVDGMAVATHFDADLQP